MVVFKIDVVVDPRRAKDGSRQVERGLGRVERKANTLGATLKRAFAFVGVTLLIRSLGRLSDTFINVQNRLKLTAGEGENLSVVMDELFNISNRTRVAFNATSQIFTRLALSAGELGRSQEELLQFTESLNQAVILSGASAIEARGALIQLSQGLAIGTLRGDELRSVMEQLPIVADVIAKSLGVTRSEVRQLGLKGKISADIILEAFKEARGELEDKFAKTIPTIGQSLQVLNNAVLELVGTVGEATGGVEGLAGTFIDLAKNIQIAANIVKEFKEELGEIARAAPDDIALLGELSRAVVKAFKPEDIKRVEELEAAFDALAKAGLRVGESIPRPRSFTDAFPDPTALDKARKTVEELGQTLNFNLGQEFGIGVQNLFEAIDKGVESLAALNDRLERQNDLLREIGGPLGTDVKLFMEDLNALQEQGRITTEEFTRAQNDLALAILESSTTLEDGFTRAFIRITQEAENLAAVGEDVVNVFADQATNALVEFAKTGTLSFRELAISILDDLTRIIARLLVVQALNAVFGGGGAGVVNTAAGGALPGREHGGRVRANEPVIVGERRPELFVPDRPGTIVPNVEAAMAPQVNVQVVTVDDPNMVPAVIESGEADEVILNVLARNTQKANRILGNS